MQFDNMTLKFLSAMRAGVGCKHAFLRSSADVVKVFAQILHYIRSRCREQNLLAGCKEGL